MTRPYDAEIRALHQALIAEAQGLSEKLSRVREAMIDCELALTATAKHPNDPDYPAHIEPARGRCADYLARRLKQEI